MIAQNAMPFLHDVVMFVTLTPLYPAVTDLHHSSRSCVGVGLGGGADVVVAVGVWRA